MNDIINLFPEAASVWSWIISRIFVHDVGLIVIPGLLVSFIVGVFVVIRDR